MIGDQKVHVIDPAHPVIKRFGLRQDSQRTGQHNRSGCVLTYCQDCHDTDRFENHVDESGSLVCGAAPRVQLSEIRGGQIGIQRLHRIAGQIADLQIDIRGMTGERQLDKIRGFHSG